MIRVARKERIVMADDKDEKAIDIGASLTPEGLTELLETAGRELFGGDGAVGACGGSCEALDGALCNPDSGCPTADDIRKMREEDS